MLFKSKKLPEIINLTRFLKSFWILYIDQIIVYNTFYSTLTFYIIKDRCQMHALKVFRSPVWLLLHKLSSPHYRYIRKMRRGDRLPLTQIWFHTFSLLPMVELWPFLLGFGLVYKCIYLHMHLCVNSKKYSSQNFVYWSTISEGLPTKNVAYM